MRSAEQRAVPPWRTATRHEVKQYYEHEFPTDQREFPAHISVDGPAEWAIAFRRRYPTRGGSKRKFIRRQNGGEMHSELFPTFASIVEFIRSPGHNDPLLETNADQALADADLVGGDAIEMDRSEPPISHAVYYKLQQQDGTWVLALDIDAKDIAQNEAAEQIDAGDGALDTDNLLKASGIIDDDPEGYKYAFRHVGRALDWGFEIEAELQSTFGFENTFVVYSGQGCHVYGLDREAYHRYDQRTREVLNSYFDDVLNAPIDTKVTADTERVIRLPYSLHADVCRIVTPITSPDFDFRTAAAPDFLDDADE